MQTVLSLRVQDPSVPGVFDELYKETAKSPEFYRFAPVILDVAPMVELEQSPRELRKIVAKIRACQLIPIGIQNGDEQWSEEARKVSLSVFPPGSRAPVSRAPEVVEAKAESDPPVATSQAKPVSEAGRSATIVRDPVRSGQQVFAHGADLVCLSAVANGAEVIASGNLHIYASLKGRAFAGIDGDESAMIFCDRLDPELVSIAGFHLVNEQIEPSLLNRRVRIRCTEQKLMIEAVD